MLVVACKKEGALPYYSSGNAPVLTASKSAVAATPADSDNVVVTLLWTNPVYANDATTTKYVIEVDSTGRNFAKSVSMTLTGTRTKALTGRELNGILLGFGFNFNVSYGIDIRVTSSYANNNDLKVSNTVKIDATPYKVPPKVVLPTTGRLFIIGAATDHGWNNDAGLAPTQEFAQLDETTFTGVFYLTSGQEYLILPVNNGDWSHKYAIANKFLAGASDAGKFDYDISDNFPAPSTTGWYKVTIDFQRGVYAVAPFTGSQLPTDLFMVGDATPASWSNPTTGSTVQALTRMNSCVWEMPSIAITGGKEFLVLPVAGAWSNKYSVANKSLPGLSGGGDFGYNFNDNFPGPTVSGNYKFQFNFATAKFKPTKL